MFRNSLNTLPGLRRPDESTFTRRMDLRPPAFLRHNGCVMHDLPQPDACLTPKEGDAGIANLQP
jgi:hypothetical protein